MRRAGASDVKLLAVGKTVSTQQMIEIKGSQDKPM